MKRARSHARSRAPPAALALALSLRYANVLRGILSSGTVGDAERQFVAHFRQTHAIGDAEHAAGRARSRTRAARRVDVIELAGGPSPRLRWWTRRNRESDGGGGWIRHGESGLRRAV